VSRASLGDLALLGDEGGCAGVVGGSGTAAPIEWKSPREEDAYGLCASRRRPRLGSQRGRSRTVRDVSFGYPKT